MRWAVCFALLQQHAPRVAASSASSGFPGTIPSAWQQEVPNNQFSQGSPSSDDEGELTSDTEEEEAQHQPFVVLPNDAAEHSDTPVKDKEEENMETGEISRDHDMIPDQQDNILTSAEEDELTDSESEDETDWQQDGDDGTAGMASQRNQQEKGGENSDKQEWNEDLTVQPAPIDAQEAIVSDAEAEWFDSDDVTPDATAEKKVDMAAVSEAPKNIEGSEKFDISINEADEVPADDETQTPVQEALVEDDSEADSDEDVDSIASREVESENEASDWSEDERIIADDDDESDVVELNSVAASASEPSVSARPAVTASTRIGPVMASPTRTTRKDMSASVTTMPHGRKKRRTTSLTRHYGNPYDLDSSSQPLKTLQKLQHMLDETDYMTATHVSRGDGRRREPPVPGTDEETMLFDQETVAGGFEPKNLSPLSPRPDSIVGEEANVSSNKLWTSKDRMKYKKQQQRIRRAQKEQRRLEDQLRSPPVHPNSSDDEDTDDTDDGLGYTLPNLPVYFSDAEGTTTDLTDIDHPSNFYQGVQQQPPLKPPPPPFEQRGTYQYPPPGYYPPNGPQFLDQKMGQPMPPYMGYPPHPYGPYGNYGPYSQQQIASQYAAAWAAAAASAGMPPYGAAPPPYRRPYPPQTSSSGLIEPRKPDNAQPAGNSHESKQIAPEPNQEVQTDGVVPPAPLMEFPVATLQMNAHSQLSTMTNVRPVSEKMH